MNNDPQKLLDQLISSGNGNEVIIASSNTISNLEQRGVPFTYSKEKTIEEDVKELFLEKEKSALEIAKRLPTAPINAGPEIKSLYDEIRTSIILGLNGAAITLSSILVEYILRYAILDLISSHKYSPELWDEYENKKFEQLIDQAKRLKLIDKRESKQVKSFKNDIRNPYAHYNLKAITKGGSWEKVKILSLETGEIEEKTIKSEENVVIQHMLKPRVDAFLVFSVFQFADQFTKVTLERLKELQSKVDNPK